MPEPITIAIAAALAGKAAGALAAGGKSALGALAKLVRERFAKDEAARAALTAAEQAPDDAERTRALGAQLERLSAADPGFAEQLRALWREASVELHADRGGVVNEVSGTVTGPVVQARDIQGGVTFGGSGG